VAKALDDLFRALQAEEEGRPISLQANGDVPCDGGSSERAVIAPTALREALSAAGGQGFEIGAHCFVFVRLTNAAITGMWAATDSGRPWRRRVVSISHCAGWHSDC